MKPDRKLYDEITPSGHIQRRKPETWPPAGVLLSDHNAYLVLRAEIPGKERGMRWPDNFSCKGWLKDTGFGEPAQMKGDDGESRYVVQGNRWIFLGEQGAKAGLSKKLPGGSKTESALPKFTLGPKCQKAGEALQDSKAPTAIRTRGDKRRHSAIEESIAAAELDNRKPSDDVSSVQIHRQSIQKSCKTGPRHRGARPSSKIAFIYHPAPTGRRQHGLTRTIAPPPPPVIVGISVGFARATCRGRP